MSARAPDLPNPEPPRLPWEQTMNGMIGIEAIEHGETAASARFPVTDAVRQPFGMVHGGAYAAVAEFLASSSTARVVRTQGCVATGQSNHTTFLRPVFEGHVHAAARRLHGGRSSWLWEVELTDDQGRLCALSLVTVAVRPPRTR